MPFVLRETRWTERDAQPLAVSRRYRHHSPAIMRKNHYVCDIQAPSVESSAYTPLALLHQDKAGELRGLESTALLRPGLPANRWFLRSLVLQLSDQGVD